MPSAKEIKSRIASIKDTQKITNAMYLISSTKLRKAKNELNRTRRTSTRSKAKSSASSVLFRMWTPLLLSAGGCAEAGRGVRLPRHHGG